MQVEQCMVTGTRVKIPDEQCRENDILNTQRYLILENGVESWVPESFNFAKNLRESNVQWSCWCSAKCKYISLSTMLNIS